MATVSTQGQADKKGTVPFRLGVAALLSVLAGATITIAWQLSLLNDNLRQQNDLLKEQVKVQQEMAGSIQSLREAMTKRKE